MKNFAIVFKPWGHAGEFCQLFNVAALNKTEALRHFHAAKFGTVFLVAPIPNKAPNAFKRAAVLEASANEVCAMATANAGRPFQL
jgi:hypothetical protein